MPLKMEIIISKYTLALPVAPMQKTVLRTCRRWKFLNHQKHKQIADFFVLENIVIFQKRAVVKNDKNLVI